MTKTNNSKENAVVARPLRPSELRQPVVLQSSVQVAESLDAFIGQERFKEAIDSFLSGVEKEVDFGHCFVAEYYPLLKNDPLKKTIRERLSQSSASIDEAILVNHFMYQDDTVGLKGVYVPANKSEQFESDMTLFMEDIVDLYMVEKKKYNDSQRSKKDRAVSTFARKISELKGLKINHRELGNQIKLLAKGEDWDLYETAVLPRREGTSPLSVEDKNKKYERAVNIFEEKIKEIFITQPGLEAKAKEIIERRLDTFIDGHQYLSDALEEKDNALHFFFDNVRANLPRDLAQITAHEDPKKKLKDVIWNRVSDESKHLVLRYKPRSIVGPDSRNGRPFLELDDYENEYIFGGLSGKLKEHGGASDEGIISHTYFRSGKLLKANKGVLVINASEIAQNEPNESSLRDLLLTIERGVAAVTVAELNDGWSHTKTCPLPCKTKLMLIGTSEEYEHLSTVIPEFSKFFTHRAQYAYAIPMEGANVEKFEQLIRKRFVDKCGFNVDKSAIETILQESMREREYNEQIVSDIGFYDAIIDRTISEVLLGGGKESVNKSHVMSAMKKKRQQHMALHDKMLLYAKLERFPRRINGEAVGEIMTLSADENHGQTNWTTFSWSYANEPIVQSIDAEVEMSTSSHNKSVHAAECVVRNMLSRKDIPFPFVVSMTDEQEYESHLDGASAGLPYVMGILSTLSGVALKKNYAATGEISLNGEVMNVGGISNKIEGHFDLCYYLTNGFKKEGSGEYGVLIPYAGRHDMIVGERVTRKAYDIENPDNPEGIYKVVPVKNIAEAIPYMFGENVTLDKLCSKIKTRADTGMSFLKYRSNNHPSPKKP